MYTEFFKKNSSNILKYLQKLGKKKKIYSKRCEEEIPMLEDHIVYVYATESELAVVVIEPGSPGHEADKDTLAWGLAVSCEMIRNRMLRLSRHIPYVFGLLVTGDTVMESSKDQSEWDRVNVSVIGGVKDLEAQALPVNPDEKLPIAFPLSFIFQAEYTGTDIECANDHLCEMAGYTEPLSQQEIAAQLGINLADFGLVFN